MYQIRHVGLLGTCVLDDFAHGDFVAAWSSPACAHVRFRASSRAPQRRPRHRQGPRLRAAKSVACVATEYLPGTLYYSLRLWTIFFEIDFLRTTQGKSLKLHLSQPLAHSILAFSMTLSLSLSLLLFNKGHLWKRRLYGEYYGDSACLYLCRQSGPSFLRRVCGTALYRTRSPTRSYQAKYQLYIYII